MKMGNKQILSIVFSVVLLLSFVSSVYAITGSIGNAKMILRPEVGEEVRRSILVKNVNDVALDITLTASGELVNNIKIEDEEFRLEAGDERKAYFTIKSKNPGTFENKINVKFSPVDGGDGVGLISTVILIAEGDSEEEGFFGGLFGGEEGEEVVEGNQENGEVSVGQNEQEEVVGEVGASKSGSLVAWSGGFTIILFIALLVVLVIASNRMKKKGLEGIASKSSKDDSGHISKPKKESDSDD